MRCKLLLILAFLLFTFTLASCSNKINDQVDNDINTNTPSDNENNDLDIPNQNEPIKPEVPKDEEKVEPEKPNEDEEIDYTKAIFASSNGSGTGSYDSPYSLQAALSKLTNDKILYLLGGYYNVGSVIKLTSFGNKDSYYRIFSYNDEKVVLDFGKDYFKDQTLVGNYNSEKAKGIVIKGQYYHIKGLTITNCGAQGLQISGSYNIIENCVFAYNGNTGCSIGGASGKPYNEWPHDNLIKNCTSYGNYDWDRLDNMQGEDADGFGCKLTTGPNNIFDGCIAYNNSDDGWDLFTKHLTGPIGSVTIKNSIAFSNGFSITGESLKNGNGFKLGGRAIEVDHLVENCVAFNNKSNGFDDNSNPGTITLKKCTSYNNGARNYAMGRFLDENNTYTSTWYEDNILFGPIENVKKSHNIFESCISYDGGIADSYSGIAQNCYFYNTNNKYVIFDLLSNCNSKYVKGKEINIFNPFLSTTIDLDNLDNVHYDFRNDDYIVNLNLFLKIKDEINIGASLH